MNEKNEVRHGPWTITFDPPPIPIRTLDWEWFHDDYDGPPDWRCGRAASVEDALAEIAEREDDEADWREHVAMEEAA